MTTLFISDLHLSESQPALTTKFLQFIHTYASKAHTLYILGDFFEVWIGDDNNGPFVTEIVDALKKCSVKTQIFIMTGNRDFLLGNAFAERCGARLIKDPTVIDLYGVKTLLTHGDLLCTHDKAYQYWRRVVHFRWLQKLFLLLPLPKRLAIASHLREKSKNYVKSLDAAYMDINLDAMINLMRRYDVKQLIHGHTHKPCIHYLQLDGLPTWHYVLSDWHETATALVFLPLQPPTLFPAL
jgi:UDP-2,3-diacylglucosamine hydrolase